MTSGNITFEDVRRSACQVFLESEGYVLSSGAAASFLLEYRTVQHSGQEHGAPIFGPTLSDARRCVGRISTANGYKQVSLPRAVRQRL